MDSGGGGGEREKGDCRAPPVGGSSAWGEGSGARETKRRECTLRRVKLADHSLAPITIGGFIVTPAYPPPADDRACHEIDVVQQKVIVVDWWGGTFRICPLRSRQAKGYLGA